MKIRNLVAIASESLRQEIKLGRYEKYRHWITRQWRWRYRAANGKIIFASTEYYWNDSAADRAIKIAKNSKNVPVIEMNRKARR